MHVLLLEDDLELGAALRRALDRAGFTTRWVRLVATAKDILANEPCTLAVLDIGVPDGSGLDLLLWTREQGLPVPVIMLTARSAVADRVFALDSGADDYLPKPFALEEFLSRARALVRRGGALAARRWKVGTLEVDFDRRRIWRGGVEVELTPSEHAILLALASRPGRVLTRTHLERATGIHGMTDSNAIEVHMHNLRRKLNVPLIRTVRGVGYVIDPPAA